MNHLRHKPGPMPCCGLRHHFCYPNNMPYDHEKERIVLPEPTAKEAAEIKCNILILKDLAPEFEGFVRECGKTGLITDWRALTVEIL